MDRPVTSGGAAGMANGASGADIRVSVVIPCHNAVHYLAQTIGSVLEQTRPADEIVVVDDGSTDGSLDLALAFRRDGPTPVRVFSERCGRAARTRNLGALAATGTALMFLDADDVLGPDALAALVGALSTEPAGVAACPWYRLQQVDGRWVRRPPSCAPRRPGQDPLSAWLTGWYHPPCSVLWSRTAFVGAGRWDELGLVNDDGDLMMRALATGIPLRFAQGGAAYYRRLPAGETSLSGRRLSRDGLADRLRTVRKIASLLQDRRELAPYRAPLAAALARIATEAAAAGEREIARAAAQFAREYGGTARRPPRLPGRLRSSPRLGGGQDASPPNGRCARTGGGPAGPSDEVRCGLDAAATLAPDRPAPGASRVERPVVSVILPTYNRAHLLPRAIGSILAQTFGDFEVIAVDDGSTDETAAIVARFADARIRYVRQENGGVASARNRGLRDARGELIAFLDSDDEWSREKLARQVARFAELPPEVGLMYCGVENVDARGTRSIRTPAHRGDLYRELLLRNVIHGTSGVVMRRSVVAAAGFFDEQFPAIEDYDYWVRAARFFRIEFVPEPLLRYHDPTTEDRKSLNLQENLDARWCFYRKHAAEMRRAGVAHLFLLTSVRRALKGRPPQLRTARRLAACAVFEAPTSRAALATLARTWLRRASAPSAAG